MHWCKPHTQCTCAHTCSHTCTHRLSHGAASSPALGLFLPNSQLCLGVGDASLQMGSKAQTRGNGDHDFHDPTHPRRWLGLRRGTNTVVLNSKYLAVTIETQARAHYREAKSPVLLTSSSLLLESHGLSRDPSFTNEQRPHREKTCGDMGVDEGSGSGHSGPPAVSPCVAVPAVPVGATAPRPAAFAGINLFLSYRKSVCAV